MIRCDFQTIQLFSNTHDPTSITGACKHTTQGSIPVLGSLLSLFYLSKRTLKQWESFLNEQRKFTLQTSLVNRVKVCLLRIQNNLQMKFKKAEFLLAHESTYSKKKNIIRCFLAMLNMSSWKCNQRSFISQL